MVAFELGIAKRKLSHEGVLLRLESNIAGGPYAGDFAFFYLARCSSIQRCKIVSVGRIRKF